MLRFRVCSSLFRVVSFLLPFVVKQFFLRIKYSRFLKTSSSSQLSLGCIFKGKNLIGNRTEFFRSELGFGSYVANESTIRCTRIGAFCCIGDNVRTGLGRHPTRDFVSVHPAFFSASDPTQLTFASKQLFDEHLYVDVEKKYFVEIGSDVWIGNNVIIMDGITIGHGAIIAAGAVVTKSVAPYSVVGGVPAKFIKYRFSEEEISFLLRLKWWEKGQNWLRVHASSFVSISELRKVLDQVLK